MSNKENEKFADTLSSTEKPADAFQEDPLADTSRLISQEIPPGVDRREFPDTERRGRCCRRDDGSRSVGEAENGDGHRHDAAGRRREGRGRHSLRT